MHPNNKHQNPYNFSKLVKANPDLNPHVYINKYSTETIDFANADAVFQLNKAILITNYNLNDYYLPAGYLCPAIPGRADYIHYLNDLISTEKYQQPITGLDIGTGANTIYPILGSQIYSWNMVGCDINQAAIMAAKTNIKLTKSLSKSIEVRWQKNPAYIFKDIIKANETYAFTMCNPPFHNSKEAAIKSNQKKLKNLQITAQTNLNFGGQAHELWCNGGEALFIKRMIKESVLFKNQVCWFTTLVSKGNNLPKLKKQLEKAQATYKIIAMKQGQKNSRILAWQF